MLRKLKNSEVVEIYKALKDEESILYSSDPDKKLPIRILWAIDGNLRLIESSFNRIRDLEIAINDEFFTEEKCDKRDDGVLELKQEFRQAYADKKKELFSIEEEYDLKLIIIDDLEGFNFTPKDFSSIRFMLTEGF